MATPNKALTAKARQALSGNWGLAVGANLIFLLINSAGNGVGLIVGGPMQQGISLFSLKLSRGKKAELENLFEGFKNFTNSLVAYLLMVLYVFLWMLLLIIPGIIAAIGYAQTFYILAEDGNIKGSDALRKSQAMMKGYKWKYFCLCLRFTGWFILSILTLGVGFIFLAPYANVSFANFYEDIKG